MNDQKAPATAIITRIRRVFNGVNPSLAAAPWTNLKLSAAGDVHKHINRNNISDGGDNRLAPIETNLRIGLTATCKHILNIADFVIHHDLAELCDFHLSLQKVRPLPAVGWRLGNAGQRGRMESKNRRTAMPRQFNYSKSEGGCQP